MPRRTAGKLLPKKTVKTAKQIAAATKNILAYEKKDDHQNILIGFVLGASVVLIAAFIARAL
jgi:hypothetical protein